MAKAVIFSVFFTVVSVSHAGTIAYQNRDTTLDELKAIDSYVSGGLPILQDGFFIGTSRGPVLVKSGAPPGANSRPTVRSKYYNTLPRLIPAGFEGIAISHFNLGAANPIFPKPLINTASANHPVTLAQPQQYNIESSPVVQQAPEQYIEQSQPVYEQAPQHHNHHHHQQQYVAEAQEPQQYITQPQQQYDQQLFQYPQQYFLPPSQQLDAQQSVQEPTQITSRVGSQTLNSQSAPPAPASFQVDNLLRDQEQVTAYQTQVFGAERFQSQKLHPNAAVVATSEYEDALPDTLRNKFYRNANLAQILAQESLPVQGEQIIGGDWDTNKIGKGKIHALLRGAGLI